MSIGQNTSGQLDKQPTPTATSKGWWKFILPLVLMLAVLGTLLVANNASAGVVTNPVGGQNPDQASGQAPASTSTPEKHDDEQRCQYQASTARGALCGALRPVQQCRSECNPLAEL